MTSSRTDYYTYPIYVRAFTWLVGRKGWVGGVMVGDILEGAGVVS
jgi:hypothetical protein